MQDGWDDMRIFLAVVRGESLSAAGRALRLDAATVGRRVARLEEQLGAPLFAKSPQGYALTEAGARLVIHAEAAEQAMSLAAEWSTRPCRGSRRPDPHRRAGRLREFPAAAGLRRHCRGKPRARGADRRPAARGEPVAARGGHGHRGVAAHGRPAAGAEDHRLSPAPCRVARLPAPARSHRRA